MKNIMTAALITFASFSTVSQASILNTQINMDNGYAVYLSTSDNTQGTLFGSGNDWYSTFSDSISLNAGTDYYLHVYGYDQGGIAGFLGKFNLTGTDHTFSNNSNQLLTNTTDWKGNNTGWGTYTSVNFLSTNANSFNSWGTSYTGAIPSTAEWIWAGNADTDNIAYFSTKISATQSVPTPPALVLFGAGLLGFMGMRKKHSLAASTQTITTA